MPVNWLDNLPDDLKKRSFLSNNSHNRVEVEQIPKFTSKENWDHISGEAEPSKTMHITSDEQVEVLLSKSIFKKHYDHSLSIHGQVTSYGHAANAACSLTAP